MSIALAVSNIAWTPAEDDDIAAMLAEEGATAIEIAPTSWRADPYDAAPREILALRRRWDDRGLPIVSLQSLLFGRADLHLFGSDESRAALGGYLQRAIDFAHALGAGALVFGSPRNRRRETLPLADAMATAAEFFRPLAEYAHARGTAICLEANPPAYGGDFLLTTAEAVALCKQVDHPGVRVNGDLGGMILSGDDVPETIAASAAWFGHFHASEPQLARLESPDVHAAASAALTRAGYRGWVSIEMRRASDRSNLASVRDAVRLAAKAYL